VKLGVVERYGLALAAAPFDVSGHVVYIAIRHAIDTFRVRSSAAWVTFWGGFGYEDNSVR
jgi:hypothetical protein